MRQPLQESPALVWRHRVLALGVALAIVLPLLGTGERIPPLGDYTQYAARHLHLRMAWLEEGRLAERSSLMGGGYPIIGDPEDPSFNPLSLLTIAFGEVYGLKLVFALVTLLGALGFFELLRQAYGRSSRVAAFGAMLFAALPWSAMRFSDGNPNEIYFSLLPCVALLIHRAQTRPLSLFWASFLLMTMLSDGKLVFVGTVLFLGGVYGLQALSQFRQSGWAAFEPCRAFAVVLAMTALGFLFRILPALELIGMRGGLARMDLHFHADHYSAETIFGYPLKRFAQELIGYPSFTGGRLTSFGFGVFGLALAAYGLFRGARAHWPLLVMAALFAGFSFAHESPIDLFRPLWHLPVTSAINIPAKYFGGPVMFALALFAALGLARLLARQKSPRLQSLLWLCAALLAVLPPALHSARMLLNTHRFERPWAEVLPAAKRYSVQSDQLLRGRFLPFDANTYFNLRRGVGTLDWYTGIPLDEVAIPRAIVGTDGVERPNPSYRGEVWLEGFGQVLNAAISHHEIAVLPFELPKPARLCINQSYHADWSLEGHQILNHQGLLAVDLPAGSHQLTLRYASQSMHRGLWLSGFFWLLVVAIAVKGPAAWMRIAARPGLCGAFGRGILVLVGPLKPVQDFEPAVNRSRKDRDRSLEQRQETPEQRGDAR